MENPAVESHAADLLLRRGVRLQMRAPFFMRWLGKKTVSLTVRSPYEGTLARVAKYYLSTGITLAQLDDITHEQALVMMLQHGKAITKAVAVGWLNGWISGLLFVRPLSWYMRWHCKPQEVLTIAMILLLYGGVSDFMSTTRSVRMMKVTTPKAEMGQMMKGS